MDCDSTWRRGEEKEKWAGRSRARAGPGGRRERRKGGDGMGQRVSRHTSPLACAILRGRRGAGSTGSPCPAWEAGAGRVPRVGAGPVTDAPTVSTPGEPRPCHCTSHGRAHVRAPAAPTAPPLDPCREVAGEELRRVLSVAGRRRGGWWAGTLAYGRHANSDALPVPPRQGRSWQLQGPTSSGWSCAGRPHWWQRTKGIPREQMRPPSYGRPQGVHLSS